jgi:branched-chain amino acid transport system ATP-binding protein
MSTNSLPVSEVPLLSARDLTKRFGGLAAVNQVSVDLWLGQIHAVIGPNGAGKSTLTNLLSGDLPATSGTVNLRGQDISGWSPEKISSNGLGRSYQKTNIFQSFSVWENVRLAAQSRSQPSAFNPLHWWRSAFTMHEVNERAERAMELAGLQNRRHHVAGEASHGEQRQLEIAMLRLKRDHAIMLVEHDIDAIFTLSDRLTVMVNGQVIASGLPADVRADNAVQVAYLGEELSEEH